MSLLGVVIFAFEFKTYFSIDLTFSVNWDINTLSNAAALDFAVVIAFNFPWSSELFITL